MRYDDRRNFERNLASAVLAGADAIPGDIERAVRYWIEHDLPRGASRGYYALRGAISTPPAILSLARFLPDLLADATRDRLMITPADEDSDGIPYRSAGDLLDLGVHDELQHYFPPSPFRGPFLALLRLAPKVGLQLVLDLADHATRAWVARERAPRYGGDGSHPLPQRLALEAGEQEIWGDAAVWRWFRYTAVAPNPLVCALMAFERWLSDIAEAEVNDVNMERIFASVMRRTHSAAIIGVLASIAVKYPDRCANAVLPILRCPAFFFMDQERRTADMTEAATRGTAEVFETLTGDTGWREIQRAAREAHRQADLEWLAVRLMLTDLRYREELLPIIRAFPSRLPYTDERQVGDPVAEAHLRLLCEFLVSRTDVEQYEFVDLGDGRYAAQPRTIPEHLRAAQEDTQAQAARVGGLIGLKVWAMRQLEGEPPDPEGSRYPPEGALNVAKRLAAEGPDETESEYVQEERKTAIAAVAAALVRHHRSTLSDPEDVRWCREQLLVAAGAGFDDASAFADEHAVYSWGADRSAARALPYLLAEVPDDVELREAVALLSVHRVREVRALVYSSLARLWPKMPEFVWGCLAIGVGIALRFQSIRRGAAQEDASKWLDSHLRQLIDGDDVLRLEPLRDRSRRDVDWAVLESVVQVLPSRSETLPDDWTARVLDLFEDWLRFTTGTYVEIEDRAQRHSGHSYRPDDWTRVLCARLGARLLGLDPEEAHRRFVAPMLSEWERAPEMMEIFLRAFLMEASAKDAPLDGFVILWERIGMTILAADVVRERRFRHGHGIEGTLAILVFGDPMTTWRTDEFEPVERCAELISHWCGVVGREPPCFRALIRLLSTIGFGMFASHGVAWLSTCLDSDDAAAAALLTETSIAQALAALLTKAYRTHGRALRVSGETWRAFNAIVDRLVAAGEPAAAELQARIRARE